MYSDMSLKSIIPSAARRKILSLLLLGNQERYYVREIERRTGENINSVRRELENLERAGLVASSTVANLKYYSINRNSAIYGELRSIFLKTEGIAEMLSGKMGKHSGLEKAFMFGSFAAGEETGSSDIDLFLVGKVDEKALNRNVREIEMFLGRQVNYVMMSLDEFERRIREKEPFVTRVLGSPTIPLVGEASDASGGDGPKRTGKAVRSEQK